MQIILNPGEVAKLQGYNGQQLEVNEVLLRAVSLLKTIINVSWTPLDTPTDDNKENVFPNQQQMGNVSKDDQYQSKISLSDRTFIKENILNAMYTAITQL